MNEAEVKKEYYKWLTGLVEDDVYSKLLEALNSVEFKYYLAHDDNRASDGMSMRYRFCLSNGLDPDEFLDYLSGPCSVLEMMVALAVRCEEVMDDPAVGNRTSQWFWGMVTNLGLGSMTDDRFDQRKFDRIIFRFLDRDYDPDGKGGLFRIKNCDVDMRDMEIWYQLCYYMDTII